MKAPGSMEDLMDTAAMNAHAVESISVTGDMERNMEKEPACIQMASCTLANLKITFDTDGEPANGLMAVTIAAFGTTMKCATHKKSKKRGFKANPTQK